MAEMSDAQRKRILTAVDVLKEYIRPLSGRGLHGRRIESMFKDIEEAILDVDRPHPGVNITYGYGPR